LTGLGTLRSAYIMANPTSSLYLLFPAIVVLGGCAGNLPEPGMARHRVAQAGGATSDATPAAATGAAPAPTPSQAATPSQAVNLYAPGVEPILHCEALWGKETLWGTFAVGFGVLAGAGGLASTIAAGLAINQEGDTKETEATIAFGTAIGGLVSSVGFAVFSRLEKDTAENIARKNCPK
jgi:hypothetical protein